MKDVNNVHCGTPSSQKDADLDDKHFVTELSMTKISRFYK